MAGDGAAWPRGMDVKVKYSLSYIVADRKQSY